MNNLSKIIISIGLCMSGLSAPSMAEPKPIPKPGSLPVPILEKSDERPANGDPRPETVDELASRIVREAAFASNPELPAIIARYAKAVTEYEEWRLQHIVDLHRFQLLSGRILFFMVILIVATGTTLSVVQFYLNVFPHRHRAQHDPSTGTPAEIEFSIGLDRIHIKSALIGLVMLVVSMAFLSLYLWKVYNIQ